MKHCIKKTCVIFRLFLLHQRLKYSANRCIYVMISDHSSSSSNERINWASVLLHLRNQETTESCMIITSPNMTVCSKFHEHLVSLLQLQEHCVSSIISCLRVWLVIVGRDLVFIILEQVQLCLVFSSSVKEDGKIVNTCNRCDEDTCGNNQV